MIQLPLNHAILNDQNNINSEVVVNLNDVADPNLFKPFKDILPRQLTVSGARKVAAILSENKRKIRLLETEVELEDENEDQGDDNMMEIIELC